MEKRLVKCAIRVCTTSYNNMISVKKLGELKENYYLEFNEPSNMPIDAEGGFDDRGSVIIYEEREQTEDERKRELAHLLFHIEKVDIPHWHSVAINIIRLYELNQDVDASVESFNKKSPSGMLLLIDEKSDELYLQDNYYKKQRVKILDAGITVGVDPERDYKYLNNINIQ